MLFHSSSQLATPLDLGFGIRLCQITWLSLAPWVSWKRELSLCLSQIQPQGIPWARLRLYCKHPVTDMEDLSQTTGLSHASGLFPGLLLISLKWPHSLSWPCPSYALAQPWLTAYTTSINTNHPVMTSWNTVLTRILQLSLRLAGKNSLDLVSSVGQGQGKKKQHADMHASYLLSLHQHSELVPLTSRQVSFFPFESLFSSHIFPLDV